MSEIAIRVEGLSKQYRIGAALNRHGTLRDLIVAAFRRSNAVSSNDHIWALKDTSFEVKRGEVVGVIGSNGAGKTTLLKILSRITEPTEGRVEIHGRVASLLEVGTGFHIELTGRENIYLNGAILGMKKTEIDRKFDEIVDFAEIAKFLDTPVKRYSSGMYVRLAFAVAAHLEPEILLIDEVLAVGDAAFQKKCLGKMQDAALGGRTVLFISHDMSAVVALCHRALLLDQGQIVTDSTPEDAVSRYLNISAGTTSEWTFPVNQQTSLQIMRVRFRDTDGITNCVFAAADPFYIEIEYEVREVLRDVHVGLWFHAPAGIVFLTAFDTDTEQSLLAKREPGRYLVRVRVPERLLNPSVYTVSVRAYVAWGPHYDGHTGFAFRIVDPECKSTHTDGGHRFGFLYPSLHWSTSRVGEHVHEGSGWLWLTGSREVDWRTGN